MEEKMMKLVRGLDVKGLKDLWDKTSTMEQRMAVILRDAVMNRLEEMDEEKFEQWLDDEDFTRFVA